MLKLIKSDMYKTIRRIYTKLFFAIYLLVFAGGPFFAKLVTKSDIELSSLFTGYNTFFVSIFFMALVIVDMLFSDEYKFGTMKNILSFGYSRTQVFVSKLLSGILLGVAMLFLSFGLLSISTVIAFPAADQAAVMTAVSEFAMRCVSFTPLFIAGIALGNTLAFVIRSNMMFAFGFVGIAMIPSFCLLILQNLHPVFKWMAEHSLMLQLYNFNERNLVISTGTCLLFGIVYTAIYTIIGLIIFRRMEVK